jgi:2-aminophenol/2-amino-5-chlorophenol 1,6-dioxygenase beta subunit
VDPVFPNLFRYRYDLKVDCELARLLHREIAAKNLPTKLMTNPDFRVDYGTIISGHLVNPSWDKPIIAISASSVFFDYSNEVGQDEMIKLGEATRAAVEKSGRRAVLLASTSLSHRHFTEEPALPEDMSFEHVYNHNQYIWDMQMIRLMKEGKSRELIDVMPDFIEQSVSECKTGGLTWLVAAMGFPTYKATVHAYGSVIGTGNAVASWFPEAKNREGK